MEANPVGFHTSLTKDIHDRIIAAVPRVIIQSQCAYSAGISRHTVNNWMKRGESDLTKNISSPFAHLFTDFRKAQCEIVRETLEEIRAGSDNYRALCWILEKCFREDFGSDSAEHQELVDLYKKLSESYKRLAEPTTHGALENGRKMDSESD